ncbi:MAG: DUF4465 domain-containing protein [Bacteroidia bacterium]|jgi:hypothetical protein
MKKLILLLSIAACSSNLSAQTVASFEEIVLSPNDYRDGRDSNDALTQGFSSGKIFVPNKFDTSFGGFWAGGFAISNKFDVNTDSTTYGYFKMYNSITPNGIDGSANYAIGTQHAVIRLSDTLERIVEGLYLTNSNYAYLSMKWGDMFARKFVAGDYLRIVIKGFLNGQVKDSTVTAYLAEGTTLLNNWKWVNTSSIGMVDSLQFTMESTDTTPSVGMNTPAYFCIDGVKTTTGIVNGISEMKDRMEDAYVYPNPANEAINVQVNETIRFLQIYNSNGQMMLQSNSDQVNISTLSNGLYWVKVITTSGSSSLRFVKSN